MKTIYSSALKRSGEQAFTMVEIAIAMGVIGFALVVIIGLLPIGLGVQKDNREDTIINQDSAFLMEAFRGGVILKEYEVKKPDAKTIYTNTYFEGLDILTNYVDAIRVQTYKMTVTSTMTNFDLLTDDYHAVPPPFKSAGGTNYDLTSGARIMSYLSQLKYPEVTNTQNGLKAVFVTAYMRAMTGSALEQNKSNTFVAFKYVMRPEILRYDNFSSDATNYNAYTNVTDYASTPDFIERSNRWRQVAFITNNLYEVKLEFAWPLLPNGKIGKKSQLIRTVVSGSQYTDTSRLTLFEPLSYENK
jgi:type II secretory pathway pseudopilin PulG